MSSTSSGHLVTSARTWIGFEVSSQKTLLTEDLEDSCYTIYWALTEGKRESKQNNKESKHCLYSLHDLESRHIISASRHFRIGIFESSRSFALNKWLSSPSGVGQHYSGNIEIAACHHDRSKQIDTCYHYVRECIARKDVRVEYVKYQDQVADIFTKPLRQEDFVRLRNSIGVTRQD
ncbi:hypothetical protein DVH24_003982 [Malus domestica]|uniref:Uncharacterized protein n=1 Tax=Malus domestica TaxID=3750 RepID=A0A498K504_MALDO|nr:hypothetical protein DVH24_003982 [Malus domestica]